MKATRHNGRSGKHGSYNPKHNDRRFDVSHSEHIDEMRALENVYWDCYGGKRASAETRKNQESFEEIELKFYQEHYQDFVGAQNYRNDCNGHSERNRAVADIYHNKKTCPEESIYQLGTIDESVTAETLVEITEAFLERFNEMFGEHIHILDWALHVDEATPHIHERHVFDALNSHGELAPQQDKALEELGIKLPHPDKPKSKSNNRKMVFDAICRDMFLSVCEEYGLEVDREATYGGRKYLEKQDFIIKKQKDRLMDMDRDIAKKEKRHDDIMKQFNAIDMVMACMADAAYEATCDLMVPTMMEETVDLCAANVKCFSNDQYLNSGRYYSGEKLAIQNTVERIVERIKDKVSTAVGWLRDQFRDPEIKRENVKTIKSKMLKNLVELSKLDVRAESYPEMSDRQLEVMQEAQEIAGNMVRRRGR